VSRAGEVARSGEDEVEKAVDASRGATVHKTEGRGRVRVPNTAPLYTPRLEPKWARLTCQTGWALMGQATMPWVGPLLGRH
jgi:hypothetical protein